MELYEKFIHTIGKYGIIRKKLSSHKQKMKYETKVQLFRKEPKSLKEFLKIFGECEFQPEKQIISLENFFL